MDRQNKSSPSYTLILFDFFFPSLQSIAIVIITPSAAPRSSADVCVCKREGGGGSPGVTASAIKFCAGASGDHLQRRRGFLYIWCWMQADRGGITQHAQSQSHLNTGSLDLTSCSRAFYIYIFDLFFPDVWPNMDSKYISKLSPTVDFCAGIYLVVIGEYDNNLFPPVVLTDELLLGSCA